MNARYETRLATVPFIGARAADERKESLAKNIALFLAAPFVGLAYIVLFPFAGAGMLIWIGARAAAKHGLLIGRIAKDVGLFLAAPFVALAYIVLFPFVGAGMLIWIGGRAWLKRGEAPAYELPTPTVAA
jgi:hypothetical protein